MYLMADMAYTWNVVVYAFEVVAMIFSIVMIIVGLLQNKKAQTGLSALNGGNDELFINTKERGLDRTLSIIMMSFGSVLLVITLVICVITNVHLT